MFKYNEEAEMVKTEEVLDEAGAKSNKKRNLIIAAILAAVIVIGVLALIFSSLSRPDNSEAQSYGELMDNPEITESGVAFEINGMKVGEDIWNYYFLSAAKNYANQNGGVTLSEIDWDKKDENGETVLEKVKFDAMKEIISNAAAVSRAEEWGIKLTDEDLNIIDVDLDYWKQVYGDDIYEELGMKNEQNFREIYGNILLQRRVLETASEDIEKYLPDVSLADYANDKSATVKIIGTTKDEENSSQNTAKEEIEELKARLDGGEDFDALWLETYEKLTGIKAEKPTTETVYKDGNTEENVKAAALALKIGETSDIIETSYSYMIVTRVAGYTELENYIMNESDVNINKSIIKSSKVK